MTMRNGSGLRVAFTALATLVLAVGGVTVPPPQDLKVTCHNLHVVASWDHADDQPGTSFVVTYGPASAEEGAAAERQLQTRQREVDLSAGIRGSLDRLLATYVVTVAAQRAGLRSSNASRAFSFNQVTGLDGCELDFPPVDVTLKDHKLHVMFQNPLDHYEELRTASGTEFAQMEYLVDSDGTHHRTCTEEKFCNVTFHATDPCVTLRDGFLYKDGRFPSASFKFKDSERTCADGSAEHLIVTVGISLAVLLVTAALLTLVICKVKAWTLKPSQLPKTLTRKVPVHSAWVCQDPVYDLVQTVPPSPEALHDACLSDALSDEASQEDGDSPRLAGRRVDLGDGELVMAYSELRNVPETSGATSSAGRSDPVLSGPPARLTLSEDHLPDESLKLACDIAEWEESQEEEGASSPYDRPHCQVVDPAPSTSELPRVQTRKVPVHSAWVCQDPVYDLVQTVPPSPEALHDACLSDALSDEASQEDGDSPRLAGRRVDLGDGESVMAYSELRNVPETSGATSSAGRSDPVLSGPPARLTLSEDHLPDESLKLACDIAEWEESQEEEGASSPYDRPHCQVVDPAPSTSELPRVQTRKVPVHSAWVCQDPVHDLVQTVPPSPEALHDACLSDALSDEASQEDGDSPRLAGRRVDLGDGELVMAYSELRNVPETSGATFSAGRRDPVLSGPPTRPTVLGGHPPHQVACDIAECENSPGEEGASSPYDRPHCPVVGPAPSTSELPQVRETSGAEFSAGQSDPVLLEGHPSDHMACDIAEWEESQGVEEGAASPYDRPH